jgi:tetratricopeptide (TPR) repeat protein
MVEDLLVAGWHYRRAGNHLQAELAYRQAVQLDARRADAWAALGTFCLQRSRLDEAIGHFRRALQLRADDAAVHCNLGIALASSGRLAEALASFTEAVQINPLHADARANLGNALREVGRIDDGVTCLREALILQPNHGAAHLNLGLALLSLQQTDEAIGHLRQAAQLAPGNATAQHSLGLALVARNELAEAAACFEQACRLYPGYVEAHTNLGMALGRLGNPAGALTALREAARLDPRSPEVHNAMGAALVQLGDHAASLVPIREALRLRPDFVAALVNEGNALRSCGQLDEALTSLRRALELQPDNTDAHHDLALVYSDLGRTAEALAEFDAALALRPDFPMGRKNRSLVWLRRGDWAQGWREYEWRWRCGELPEPAYPQPRWDGGDLAGKTILLWAEQGVGDTFQFVRYAAQLNERGASVLLHCPAALHPLLASCAGIDRLVGAEVPPFDVHAPLMSLPHLLGTTAHSVPAMIPYLSTDPAVAARWQQELAHVSGFRIGVCWQGNPKYAADRLRSFALAQLSPVAAVPGVRLVCVQTGRAVQQIAELRGRLEILDLGERLTRTPGAFVDAAAVIKNLDLVISCDTAIAHLAGALGAPVWLALPYASDWRWLQGRSDTPWYPTMRLFRQSEPRNWDGVFAEMAAAIARLVSRPSPLAQKTMASALPAD